jgi:hypothetical protein
MSLTCSTHAIDKTCEQIFDGKLERKNPHGRPRYRREDMLKLVLNKFGVSMCALFWTRIGTHH